MQIDEQSQITKYEQKFYECEKNTPFKTGIGKD